MANIDKLNKEELNALGEKYFKSEALQMRYPKVTDYQEFVATQFENQKKMDADKKEIEVTGKALEQEMDSAVELANIDTTGEGKKEKGKRFENFKENVGKAFKGFFDGAEKRLETVYDDREKRALFLSGLNTFIEASQYTPITQASSPLGKIAKGQKKGFLESEAISSKRKKSEIDLIKAQASLIKAEKGEPPRIRGTQDEAILKNYTPYIEKYGSDRNKFDALDTRYLEAFKMISEGKKIPTGTLEAFLFPIEKILAGTEIGDKLNKFYTNGKLNTKLIDEDNVAFKEILNSASKQAIVSQVKDLYPASDKDIQVLLQGLGDVATTPEALIKLISAQKAASEAYKIEGNIAKQLAFPGEGKQGDINFAINAKEISMAKIAEQYNDQVSDELLVELYGSNDRSSPFRVAQAYFYSTLKPQIQEGTKTNFEIFQETTESEIKTEQKLLEDQQKKFMDIKN
tara:strand:- start:3467 stop:4843 length:1377 start_codon:yes stop_codon:yes gene_type:complete